MNIKSWLNAFRLRTLPLALSSIIMGIIVSKIHGLLDWRIGLMAIITTLFLQILSNLANDYGDGIKGTDNRSRLGPERTIQSGKITPKQMKLAIFVFSALSLISGVYLIILSEITLFQFGVFLTIGILAILSAIYYTVGKKSYGYYGLGDLFVFVFFGIIAVLGTFFLNTKYLSIDVLLPALTVGFLSTAVLNLNNMRDLENDQNSGKITFAVKLGLKGAKLYQTILVNSAFFSLLFFVILRSLPWQLYLSFLLYPLFLLDLNKIEKTKDLQKIDPFLKLTAIKTFMLVIIFGILEFLFN